MGTAIRTRITSRLPADSFSLVEEAAAFLGVPVNSFVTSAAIEKASDILAGERVIKLGRKDAEMMEKLMLRPPAPNKALISAAAAYKKNICAKA